MNDKTLVERAVAVPLLERLRRVPNDARLEYEHDSCHHSLFPIGAMCHEAATRIEALEAALREIAGGAKTGEEMFKERLGDWLYPTWFVVNVLQDSLAACHATAERALESKP